MSTNTTTLRYLAATAEDWRAVVRAAVALDATGEDCWGASDDAWDAGDLRAAKALARAAAWFSETPAQRRASRAFPAPESIGVDTLSPPSGLLGGQSILGGRPSQYAR